MRIGIIGHGNMGRALTKLFNRNGFVNFTISDVDTKKTHFSNARNIAASDILFLCVKSEDIPNVLSDFSISQQKIVISMASTPISKFPSHLKVIRMVPNLSIQYGVGIIPYYSQYVEVPSEIRKHCKGLELIKCAEEKLLD